MKVRLTLGATDLTALTASLPLKLTMSDLFGRGKYARLNKALPEGGDRVGAFAVGQLACWSAGQDLAIFHRHDGEPIPAPGIIVFGTIDGPLDAFHDPDPVEVTIERAD